MDIEGVRLLKSAMTARLKSELNKEISQFEVATGVMVSSIKINLVHAGHGSTTRSPVIIGIDYLVKLEV